jgi:hypothetical protein
MKTRHYLIALAMLMGGVSAQAQALWTSAEAKARLAKGLSVYAEGEYRTADGMDTTDRIAASAGLNYRLLKPLKIGAGYTYIHQREATETTHKGNIIPTYWQPKHRLEFDVTGTYRTGRIQWSLRERYQLTHRTSQTVKKFDSDGVTPKSDELIEANTKHMLRSRLEAEYLIKKSRFTPFASMEVYNSLTDGFDYKKFRLTLGTDYKLARQHSLSLYYRYINRDDSDEKSGHVVGIGYTFKAR